MIQQFFNAMITLLLVSWGLNDLPHAAGLFEGSEAAKRVRIEHELHERIALETYGKPYDQLSPVEQASVHSATVWDGEIERRSMESIGATKRRSHQ